MKRALKITLVTIAVLLAILIIVPMTLESKVGDIVKKEANSMLSARLDFSSLNISLIKHFPHASVELNDMVLVCAEPFETDTIVAAKQIAVVVNLMSLFGDSGFEVTKLILDSPNVYAHVNADGVVNWNVMKESEDTETPDEGSETTDSSSFTLQMRDFQIVNARIRYDDQSSDMSASVYPLNVRLTGDMSAESAALNLDMDAKGVYFTDGGMSYLSNASSTFKALIAADMEHSRYELSNNTLTLNAIKASVEGWVALNDESTDMDLKLNSSEIALKDILSLIPAFYTKDFENLTAKGELTLSAWAKGTMTETLLPQFQAELVVKDGGFKYASLPKSVDNINISAKALNPGGSADATTIDVPIASLSMAGNTLKASFYAATPISDMNFKATADGKIDLGAVKDIYPLGDSIVLSGLVTANVSVAGRMSDIEKERYDKINAKGTFVVEGMEANVVGMPVVAIKKAAASINSASMSLTEFSAKIGNSDISANGSLNNYIGYFMKGTTLSGRLSLNSDLLDLNELMQYAGTDSTAVVADASSPVSDSAAVSAVEIPQNLNLTLSADIAKILYEKMVLTNFTGLLTMANGTLTMNKLAMNAFGGDALASGSYSTAKSVESPELKLAMSFTKASFAETFNQIEMVQKIAPIFEKTGGDYSMKLDMNTLLTNTMDVDYNSMNGSGNISSENIDIQNLEVMSALATALKNDKLKSINAKDVNVKFTIDKGRVTTQPFDLKMGSVSMNLSGSTGLDQTIDYTAKVTLPEGATSGILSNVNVGIGGTYTSPKITVGAKEALKEAATNVITKELQKLTDTTNGESGLKKQLDKVKSLFGK